MQSIKLKISKAYFSYFQFLLVCGENLKAFYFTLFL